jgi:acyl-CoA synthetase (AMP-forming)/AMP-acid ligase II
MLLHEQLCLTKQKQPDLTAFRFLADGEEVTVSLTYAELYDAAEQQALWMTEAGLSGRPVALIFEPGVEFVICFFACLMSGAIAVPLPSPGTRGEADRVMSSLDDLGQAVILTKDTLADLPVLKRRSERLLVFNPNPEVTTSVLNPVTADTLAVVQYSSGSTAQPRGIVLTQGNISANLTMIKHMMGVRPGNVCVSWLPHSHDMGLFGTILGPLWTCGTVVLMPPNAFLRRPVRWLRALDQHGGTHMVGPNFGYALAARAAKRADLSDLDLTSLEVACIGAEPTLPATLKEMVSVLGSAGFTAEAFQSCYGLAEATLLCTSGCPDPDSTPVSCGRPAPGCEIRLRPCPEFPQPGVGEVMIAGPHVSSGLWDAKSDTGIRPFPGQETDANGTVFVPTGDVGRITGGELYFLDRVKDLLPIRGGTLGPVEVERAVCDLSAVIETATAVPDDVPGSYVVRIAVELARKNVDDTLKADLRRSITETLARRFGIQVSIWFFTPRKLPRTTSGKIRRFEARRILSETETEHEPV